MQFIGSFGFFGSSVFTHGIIGVYRIPKNMATGLVLGNGESISQHQCHKIITRTDCVKYILKQMADDSQRMRSIVEILD